MAKFGSNYLDLCVNMENSFPFKRRRTMLLYLAEEDR